LLAELVRLAPPVGRVGELSPSPPWVAWDHREAGLWPAADDREEDLNAVRAGAGFDEVARAVRQRLARFEGAETIVGHGDFEAQNVRWSGGEPVAVHDWDSAIAAAEPVLVGHAAAVWPAGMEGCFQATVRQTEEFLEAYQGARGIRWGRDEVEAAWAAGLWVLAFNAKKASIDGVESLTHGEIAERMCRSGISNS
jgi:Ser/Thr protein kinase RdoA (MazF antagonist)